MAEHSTVNRRVVGSSPTRRAINNYLHNKSKEITHEKVSKSKN